MRARVQQSIQAQMLKFGRDGTHIFIIKLGERTRAQDWYWEIWRELGGDLPPRLDVSVPAFDTTIRIPLPEDEDQVGGPFHRKLLNVKAVIETSQDMMRKVVDIDELRRQRSDRGDLDLELAWKSRQGTLEWAAWDTTVEDKKRDWALLSSIAKAAVYSC
jgi:hypothetical protein